MSNSFPFAICHLPFAISLAFSLRLCVFAPLRGISVPSQMNILLASSEVHPYSKTGGLADMVGALGKTLARAGHQVGLVTPLYEGIRDRFPNLKSSDLCINLALGAGRISAKVWALEGPAGLIVYLVEAPV